MTTIATEMENANVVSRSEWLTARKKLLVKEKELTRLRDELSRERRALPWEKVEKHYTFEGPQGRVTLGELFEKHSQLIVYHFMFAPGWEQGCPSCSFVSDHFDGTTIHLAHRDVAFTAISRASYPEIDAFKKRMGWRFNWVSSFRSDFNYDFHVSFTQGQLATGKVYYNYQDTAFPSEEAPGMSVFAKDEQGNIFHTYSSFGRGVETPMTTYSLLDMAPKGRDEDGLAFRMAWVRHHDKYADGYVVDTVQGYKQPERVKTSCCEGEHRS
jgi:predicted dithiol-disulfide oxidoreductase (DUF899 family)